MGFTILIGEAKIYKPPPRDQRNGSAVFIEVQTATLKAAPKFINDSTGQCNMRSPSYSTWSEFIEEAGIGDWFYDSDVGLMRKNASESVQLITQRHVDLLNAAYKARRKLYPNKIEGWPMARITDPTPPQEELDKYDSVAARLHWMLFFCAWAIEACEIPVFLVR